MKRFVRRWWVEHDTPEFGHSIIAGTMHRMHKVAKRDGMPICDYYTVGWIYVYIVKLWVVLWIKEKLLYNPKKGLRFFDFWSAFDLWFFNKFKKVHFHHSWAYFQKFSFSWRKYFKGTCVFFIFENLLQIRRTYRRNDFMIYAVFLGHLLIK